MTSNVISLVLDTGQRPLFTRRRRVELNRCVRCEWHPETQGHHPFCPDADYCTCPPAATADTDTDTAPYGTCARCQQPRTPLVGVDYKGRPACANCASR